MARCRGCGSDVTFVQVDGDVVPLEVWSTVMGPRFVVEDYATDPWTAIEIDPTSAAEGYSDHRETCAGRG